MAVAAGIAALEGLPYDDVVELSRRVGRGKRSSVGMHGFAGGGMILEGGKRGTRDFGPLLSRVVLPEEWRFVLLLPREGAGLSGTAEVKAMNALPSVAEDVTAEMCRTLLIELLPAAIEADFDTFADRLDYFGHLAGACFASVQGGPYAEGIAAESVAILREFGGRGIAQSSWGPGVFCVCPDEHAAEDLSSRFPQHPAMKLREIVVAKADNRGAVVRVNLC